MKKTYEMNIYPNDIINNLNNNFESAELYHKRLEDPLMPPEGESCLNVKY